MTHPRPALLQVAACPAAPALPHHGAATRQAPAMAPLMWLYAAARKAMPPPTTNGGDWYKPVILSTCLAGLAALANMWTDTKMIRADLQELKASAGQQEKDIDDLSRRVLRLEVKEQANREVLRMLGVKH